MLLGKKIKLKFSYPLGQIRFFLAVAFLLSLPAVLGSETYRMTTFYPAPFASYNNARVLTDITAGNSAITQFGYINIGTEASPNYVVGATAAHFWSRNSGDIILGAANHRINLNRGIKKFCQWRTYSLVYSNSLASMREVTSYCTAKHPLAVAIASAPNENSIVYTSTLAESGYMLCCRIVSE